MAILQDYMFAMSLALILNHSSDNEGVVVKYPHVFSIVPDLHYDY